MVKVGIVGFGFMGRMHFNYYKAMKNVKVVAICDIDPKKFIKGAVVAGNVKGTEKPLNLKGIGLFADFKKMLEKADINAISITLPTYLHCEYAVKSLEVGIHTLCEKPMALTIYDCKKMIAAARTNKRILQVGHCIRFWPQYAKAKEIIDSGKYGEVLAATFHRLSVTPTWLWNNWLMDKNKSGGAALDLHIHDSDYVQYLFGMPKEVFARGVKGPSGDYDHIVANYIYNEGKVITAEGGWVMKPGFGFEAGFNIMLEKATISYDYACQPIFRISDAKGNVTTPAVSKGDGYSGEFEHFINIMNGRAVPKVITPMDSLNSVKIILAEKKSCDTCKKVALK
ncbi:MAG: Gfo/Idh/MocA family protein [Sedimentisphaerales bacterium]